MSLLTEMMKNRSKMIEKIKTESGKIKAGRQDSYTDDRFWQPTKDKVGNAMCEIRFLPVISDELPWTEVFSHAYKNPKNNLWFIEECPTTINEKCPLCAANTVLWNTGIKSNRDVSSARKRKHRFISNVLVVDDPGAPENNGKVKLFKYGKKIFDKIMLAMHPEFKNMEPLYPFDIKTGANFLLRVRQYEGYPNYDLSQFSTPSQLANGVEENVEAILQQLVNLAEFHDASKFKSFSQLQTRLNLVLGSVNSSEDEDEDDEDDVAPAPAKTKFDDDDLPASFLSKVEPVAEKPVVPNATISKQEDDDSEIENYLKSLATDDE